jgi:hypothetical protein
MAIPEIPGLGGCRRNSCWWEMGEIDYKEVTYSTYFVKHRTANHYRIIKNSRTEWKINLENERSFENFKREINRRKP